MNIREYLKKSKLIADGSFGTYYSQKYKTVDIPEYANITAPQRISEIHTEYINSGAKLIRTNTFASNTYSLDCSIEQVKENIKAAYKIAKEAVEQSGKEIFIAGNIGPVPAVFQPDFEAVEEEYYQIAKTFIDEGADILCFETFTQSEHIMPAIKRIKEECNPFIIVQFCVNQYGYSEAGESAERLVSETAFSKCVDAVGLNCGVGPAHMQQILSRINLNNNCFVTAMPNAGYPLLVRNRVKYADNPIYFASKVNDMALLGADIIGGCCGTTPDYIREVAKTVDLTPTVKSDETSANNENEKPVIKKSFFRNADGTIKDKKLIAVELAPPFGADDKKLLEAAHMLKGLGVDVLTFPDSPSGRTRIDSVLMAQKVKNVTGFEVMPHICCRDKNAIAMRSTFLGASINDINNFLIITGDPIPVMARQVVKSVFNFDSVGLMRIADEMNSEVLKDSPLTYGGAINQSRRRIESEIKRVQKKMEAGAEFFLTQPVFTAEDAERLRRVKEETGARILCGIMPLVSRKNALFMKNEISGVNVTDEVIERYPENADREDGENVGVELAKEMIAATRDFADGYYFSFPFNRTYLLKRIIEEV
ncbi:bifunctional homocysteine S-methyltransferase/methylenetetrahydrofolate reductase [Ruminococcus bromii]|uniref:Bifunctional homocysteine S-methyltransferase/methylenetetrahydrofolate reductase n=1 Tax=Ruminococcus bromii TaxID=40518 RepID=A0ABT0NLM4_9FIRM|nr:bifunctional homocysteine S-methyltransferase/methylenetetrahydrofolate reductase [Ruminococcus bromii]MCL3788538.1 bifunctional homocysteine S-methyltransferase/methylenetetrahydrofolate reductase [Ruminococcus bromii]MDR3971382.1 bifunctional homocysteine S-methyltransferase/methylenetetrahydrofolate reductase [Ruminococcus sp.]